MLHVELCNNSPFSPAHLPQTLHQPHPHSSLSHLALSNIPYFLDHSGVHLQGK